MTDSEPVEPRIVQAVGIATSVGGQQANPALSKRLEEAMTQAVVDFQAAGITDTDEQRRLILAARDRVLDGQ